MWVRRTVQSSVCQICQSPPQVRTGQASLCLSHHPYFWLCSFCHFFFSPCQFFKNSWSATLSHQPAKTSVKISSRLKGSSFGLYCRKGKSWECLFILWIKYKQASRGSNPSIRIHLGSLSMALTCFFVDWLDLLSLQFVEFFFPQRPFPDKEESEFIQNNLIAKLSCNLLNCVFWEENWVSIDSAKHLPALHWLHKKFGIICCNSLRMVAFCWS